MTKKMLDGIWAEKAEAVALEMFGCVFRQKKTRLIELRRTFGYQRSNQSDQIGKFSIYEWHISVLAPTFSVMEEFEAVVREEIVLGSWDRSIVRAHSTNIISSNYRFYCWKKCTVFQNEESSRSRRLSIEIMVRHLYFGSQLKHNRVKNNEFECRGMSELKSLSGTSVRSSFQCKEQKHWFILCIDHYKQNVFKLDHDGRYQDCSYGEPLVRTKR